MAAELRHIDIGPRRERVAIADIAEAPDGAAIGEFEIRAARHGFAVGVKSDRVIAADGKTGMPIDHDPFVVPRRRAAGGNAAE